MAMKKYSDIDANCSGQREENGLWILMNNEQDKFFAFFCT